MADGDLAHGVPLSAGLKTRDCTYSETIRLVESTKWAQTLSAREIQTLSQYLHVYDAAEGAVIVHEAGREAYLCLLVEGHVSVVKKDVNGLKKRIGAITAGNTFGEMSLIDGEPRSASVIADETSTVIVLTGEGLARLSTEVPRLAIKVLLKIAKLISQRLRQTSGALVDSLGQ